MGYRFRIGFYGIYIWDRVLWDIGLGLGLVGYTFVIGFLGYSFEIGFGHIGCALGLGIQVLGLGSWDKGFEPKKDRRSQN